MVAIIASTQNGEKVYEVQDYSSAIWFPAFGPNGQGYAGFRRNYNATNANAESFVLAYGKQSNLAIRPSRVYVAPKTLTAKPQWVYFDSAGNATFLDATATMTFNQKATQEANSLQKTFDMVIEQMQVDLQGRNYTQIYPPQ
jgi:hypothetical protein